MKIAFPTNNQKTLSSHIGLCKGFLIIDTDTEEKFYIENPVLKTIQEEHIDLKHTTEGHRGLGTGRVIPPLLKEAGVDILVSNEFGEGMRMNLQREGIIPYLTDEKYIEEILNQIKEEDMREFNRNYINELEEENFEKGFGFGRGYGRGFGCRRERFGFRGGFRFGRRFGQGKGLGYGRGFGFRRGWEN